MAEIQGMCVDRFGSTRALLADMLKADDVGASVAIHLDGEMVVDIWGGHVDAERTIPWERDTLTNVWSTSKTMVALCALILADRGEIDFDEPVATYWPEFAESGKEGVLVRHLLGHTAGLPSWDEPMTVADLYDWPTVTARLAAQAPRWEPGTDGGYHAITQGYLVGEVIRRVTGRTVGAFLAEVVAGPLGADFHIGLPAGADHRVAPVIPPYGSGQAPEDATEPPQGDAFAVRAEEANTIPWRRAEIPAVNGFGNARSVCAIQSVLACGGTANGVRLLSAAGCERAMDEQFRGVDRILGVPMRYGLGYGMHDGQLPNPRTVFWGGRGGSMILIDLDARMTVAYVMNQMLDEGMLGDDRAFNVLAAAYEGLATE